MDLYTGSASWSYRAALEGILGFTKRGERLSFNPCIPVGWRQFAIEYRHGATTYRIDVENPDGVSTQVRAVTLDGVAVIDGEIPLVDDGQSRSVVVTMGSTSEAKSTITEKWPTSSSEITGS